ncbi:PP2C family protein-serine/threonine phosphatase [Paraburkholderia solisilvae]|uniref:Protein phosphatase PrpC n=1 Tax=Paraburkholderia solisilvae TaxID=624376 RepID=A0A6J5EU12_9BURK|nr:PP2C family serine/threonine-protein phosphatase [Paraburkholderia solisilvae]CAB3770059.1 Protein phosphatase PrpC [Paraburkholderia solisilvae]
MTTTFRSAGRTETGKVRRYNEDAILVRDDLGLWAVADGLGGHAAGDYASALIVERLGALYRDGSVYDFVESIEDSLVQVNADLRAAALARRVDVIASTVVVLVHDKDFVLCGWVGDSRGYVYEDGGLCQLTRDHVHGLKTDVTRFTTGAREQANSGVLTRAIGAEDQLHVDWAVAGSRPGMQFLLCSDGINKELSDAELERGYREHDAAPHEQLTQLFAQALGRAARDNLSAVMVRLDEP